LPLAELRNEAHDQRDYDQRAADDESAAKTVLSLGRGLGGAIGSKRGVADVSSGSHV
jgi:hypothetical protein